MKKILIIIVLFLLIGSVSAFERPRDYIDIYAREQIKQDIAQAQREAQQEAAQRAAEAREAVAQKVAAEARAALIAKAAEDAKIIELEKVRSRREELNRILEERALIPPLNNMEKFPTVINKDHDPVLLPFLSRAPVFISDKYSMEEISTITVIRIEPDNLLAQYVQKNMPFTIYENLLDEYYAPSNKPFNAIEKRKLYPIFLKVINKGNMDGEWDAKVELGMVEPRKDAMQPNWASGVLYDFAYTRGYTHTLDLFKLELI